MRIEHVADTLRVGGAEVLIAQLCRVFRQQGHDVRVHCLYDTGPLAASLQSEGFPILLHGPGSRWAVTRQLARQFQRERPDVVHCHNATATLFAAPAARWAAVPVVVSTRHGLVPPPHSWRREGQFSLTARLCTAVVGVCRATTDNLARAPLAARGRLVTIYNGAAPARMGAEPIPHPGMFTLLWVGRLAAPKDPATLLHALARARTQDRQEIALWFVGDGPLRPAAEALSRDLGLTRVVKFWGGQDCVGSFLAAADAFVLSSSSEGLPVSLLEAMAASRPCLGTATGAMPELIETGGCGLVAPVGSVTGMAAAITAMASDPDRCRSWGEAARRHYLTNFTPERMAARYLDLYRAGCKRRGFRAPLPD